MVASNPVNFKCNFLFRCTNLFFCLGDGPSEVVEEDCGASAFGGEGRWWEEGG